MSSNCSTRMSHTGKSALVDRPAGDCARVFAMAISAWCSLLHDARSPQGQPIDGLNIRDTVGAKSVLGRRQTW